MHPTARSQSQGSSSSPQLRARQAMSPDETAPEAARFRRTWSQALTDTHVLSQSPTFVNPWCGR